jgi:SulP family sulfate permease
LRSSLLSYSNAIAGLFGGIQNYMAYSNSVIYSKSKGKGQMSSLAIVAVSMLIFIYGPMMASYVPRCMAGTLLLHVGIDLFLEGAIDSYKDYDKLEYSGILLIMIVMVTFGMDAALVAGVVAALSTFLAQSIVYQDPIRGAMSGARLQSSAWNRTTEAQQILVDPKKGRQRIYVIQLQGHIFFGNVVKMTEDIKRRLNDKIQAGDVPAVGEYSTMKCT